MRSLTDYFEYKTIDILQNTNKGVYLCKDIKLQLQGLIIAL